MTKTATLWLAPLAGLLLATSAMAQEHMMNGQPIPADNVQAAQDWCDELQAQQGLTGTQEPESSMDAEQAQTAVGDQNAANAGEFDVTAMTIENCQEAGFTDQTTN